MPKPKTLKVKTFKKIPGLYYIEDVNINLEEIITKLDKNDWIPITKSSNSRKVQHYGFKYDYTKSNVNVKCDDIPKFLEPLQQKLLRLCEKNFKLINQDEDSSNNNYKFNQCIVNNYQSSQGISKHIDTTGYGKVIGCYTAGSGATMTFRRYKEKLDLYVKPNSLYIMSGDARYKWTHEMVARKSDLVDNIRIPRSRRVSITFRYVP